MRASLAVLQRHATSGEFHDRKAGCLSCRSSWAKIYRVSENSYLGWWMKNRGMTSFFLRRSLWRWKFDLGDATGWRIFEKPLRIRLVRLGNTLQRFRYLYRFWLIFFKNHKETIENIVLNSDSFWGFLLFPLKVFKSVDPLRVNLNRSMFFLWSLCGLFFNLRIKEWSITQKSLDETWLIVFRSGYRSAINFF